MEEHMSMGTLEPVPVSGTVHAHVKGDVPTKDKGADYGSWSTYVLTATQAAQKILPHDEQRRRALLLVSGSGPVYVGTQGQTQANPPVGGLLATGAVVETKNRQELWLAPDGTHTATVTLLIERYES
jgi:hypothetical protein